MISFYKIWTVVLRCFYGYKADFNKLIDFTYWPLIDLIIFGFMGVAYTSDAKALLAFMSSVLLWQVTYRSSLEIARNVLQEIWDNNIINVLATPLTIVEWLAGLMLTGLIGICFTVIFGSAVIYILYGSIVLSVGLPLILFAVLLAWSGWIVGIISSSFLVWRGQRVETLVWAFAWVPAPFCSIFYPDAVLPQWAQFVGACLPQTYIFRALRTTIHTGLVPTHEIMIACTLNTLYFVLAFTFFKMMLHISKRSGLGNL